MRSASAYGKTRSVKVVSEKNFAVLVHKQLGIRLEKLSNILTHLISLKWASPVVLEVV